ncbi:MAG: YwaF family protein [Candidatus Izemoplasmatales bacterium]|nr:YwaF family protein [Candidatus Izemoplasmatales bacterium]
MFLLDFFTTIGMDEQPVNYLFGPYHLVYFLISLISFIFLYKWIRKQEIKKQDLFINIALILILVLKYVVEIIFIYEYYFVEPAYSSYPHPFLDVNTFISFQLCGVMNIFLPITIWFDIKPLKPFVYLTSILGGLAVVLYPVTVLYGDPFQITLPMIRSSVVHFFLVLIPIILINREDIVLTKKDGISITIGLLSVATWAMFGNLFIDTQANNMYLMKNPFFGGPIGGLNILPDGFHVILLAVLVTLGYVLVYNIAKQFQKKSV